VFNKHVGDPATVSQAQATFPRPENLHPANTFLGIPHGEQEVQDEVKLRLKNHTSEKPLKRIFKHHVVYDEFRDDKSGKEQSPNQYDFLRFHLPDPFLMAPQRVELHTLGSPLSLYPCRVPAWKFLLEITIYTRDYANARNVAGEKGDFSRKVIPSWAPQRTSPHQAEQAVSSLYQ
jgi:hypothetical protein